MDIIKLTNELKSLGIKNGLCEPWQRMLSDAGDKETLVKMYLRGIDFCLTYDYPGVKYMERNFKGMCEPFGVFVNETVNKVMNLTELYKIVAVGNCSGKLFCSGSSVSQIFVKHTSILEVAVNDNANVTIDCFDNTVVNITVNDNANVTIFRYIGANVNIISGNNAKVSVIDRNKKRY